MIFCFGWKHLQFYLFRTPLVCFGGFLFFCFYLPKLTLSHWFPRHICDSKASQAALQLLLVWQQKMLSCGGSRAKSFSKIQPFVDLWICVPIVSLFYRKPPWAFDSVVSKLILSLFSLIPTISCLVKVTFVRPICSILASFFIHYPFQGIGTRSL